MSFLKDQIRDSREEKFVFPEVRRIRKEDILLEKKEYEEGVIQKPGWAARSHKIYPSSLSFGMCVYEYIQKLMSGKFMGIEDELGKYRTEAGKYKHQEIQDIWRNSPRLYTLPRIPQEMAQELIPKLISEWPEVPVRCHKTGISGKADLIIRVKNKPVLVDIKTTSKSDRDWHTLDISPQYLTQLSVYAYLMNRDGYYPDPIEKIGCAFYNMMGVLGDRGSEKEIYVTYDSALQEKTRLLLEEIEVQRTAAIEGRTSKCSYVNCHAHKKSLRESILD